MLTKLISPIILKNGQAVVSLSDPSAFGDGDAVKLAQDYSNRGADVLMIFDQSEGDEEHEQSLTLMRYMARLSDIPMWGAGNVKRVEDVKKILYAGCKKAILNYSKPSNMEMLEEVSKRFGRKKIAVCLKANELGSLSPMDLGRIIKYAENVVVLARDFNEVRNTVQVSGSMRAAANMLGSVRMGAKRLLGFPGISDDADNDDRIPEEIPFSMNAMMQSADSLLNAELKIDSVDLPDGIGGPFTQDLSADLMGIKAKMKAAGMEVNLFESKFVWDDLKLGADGLIPVVVQDYRNEEVLMVAYMNRGAYEQTIRTGVMTYWSRSRNELWVKGETSGHYQYLKELRIDCDNDTLLARVAQIGAACHTGNRSCFYRTALKKDTPHRNPMKVFEDVYGTIEDRRLNPKEGSYTNYLFNKGIDKILKKCGEEAAEIIIAAKNPNPEEVKYEMADFLYHMMVLMSERGITWDDISQELANRE